MHSYTGLIASHESPAIESQFEKWGWKHGFFSPPVPGEDESVTYFYNPSICRISDNRLLLAQRRTYWRKPISHWRHLRNHVLFSFLDPFDETLEPTLPEGIGWVPRIPNEQYEDPRICVWQNQVVMASVCWHNLSYTSKPQITLSRFNDDLQVEHRWHLPYGGNGSFPAGAEALPQKNWCPFPLPDGRLGILYHHNPHTVLSMGDWGETPREYVTPGLDPALWLWGEPRCSTPPVPIDGLYLTLFHSSTFAYHHPKCGPRMRYHVGMILFDDEPPYRILYHSRKPILSGSNLSFCPDGHPPCIFPGGLILNPETLEALVVAGLNDAYSLWFKMDAEKVMSDLLKP